MIKELKEADWRDRLIKAIASTPKGKEILYLVEHIEQRVGDIAVIENGKTSGFAKAMINEE